MISKVVTTKISHSTFSHPYSKFLATAKVGLAYYGSFRGGGSHIHCQSCPPISSNEPYIHCQSCPPFSSNEPYIHCQSCPPFSSNEPYIHCQSCPPLSSNEPHIHYQSCSSVSPILTIHSLPIISIPRS